MTLAKNAEARLERLMKWYLPARVGVFYHYGLFTGGGNASSDKKFAVPLRYKSVAEFEAAAPDPAAVAKNLVKNAVDMGAKYTILTMIHTCAGLMMLFPTKLPEFCRKTNLDYIGAYLREARKAGLYPMLYYPGDCHNFDAEETIGAVAPEITQDGCPEFTAVSCRLVEELKERYGNLIAGFWLDGGAPGHFSEVPAKIRECFPDAVIVVNGRSDFSIEEQDVGTTEYNEEGLTPPYNRAGGYQQTNPWSSALPPLDFNEDIPTPNGWSYQGKGTVGKQWMEDRFFLLHQMITSLGRRGMWNFAPGIGPMIDGRVPEELDPTMQAIHDFMEWGSESVYGTKGPAGTFFHAGFFCVFGSRGFYSVTTPLKNSSVFYVLMTEKPSGQIALFDTRGNEPKRITDLRTKRDVPFEMWNGVVIRDYDWSDVDRYGAAVLKFEF